MVCVELLAVGRNLVQSLSIVTGKFSVSRLAATCELVSGVLIRDRVRMAKLFDAIILKQLQMRMRNGIVFSFGTKFIVDSLKRSDNFIDATSVTVFSIPVDCCLRVVSV